MEREIFIIRDGAVVWHGQVKPAVRTGTPPSAQDYFQAAWRKAVEDGALKEADAASVQFRSSAP